ncbi:MAG TPA: hypothetical protein VHC19_21900 [Pirellulales bacterium]|nr:hypothetical protein [Pirellulales bacterium]
MPERPGLSFTPSRFEGLPEVTKVAVYPDHLELLSAGAWIVIRFVDIAAWRRPAFLWRWLARLGWRPHWLLVGQRNWFNAPAERFFRFNTQPRIVIYMPDEPAGTNYANTLFRRVQDIMLAGGFYTWDLG